jgi:hypothetical protein
MVNDLEHLCARREYSKQYASMGSSQSDQLQPDIAQNTGNTGKAAADLCLSSDEFRHLTSETFFAAGLTITYFPRLNFAKSRLESDGMRDACYPSAIAKE